MVVSERENNGLSPAGAEVDSDATSLSPSGVVSERPDLSSEKFKEDRSPVDSGCLLFGTRGNGGNYSIRNNLF